MILRAEAQGPLVCASLPALRDPDQDLQASRAWSQDFGALVGALAPSVRLERM